ncbi:MAG: GNAT family N-acetyltransferase [Candidatus Staskawiczbacteria bacterium]|nr:GNAT family N-acetyltransferase [Candidatus Staskawiczbacteria bacterium]
METKTFGNKKLIISPLSKKDFKFAKEFLDFINSLIEEDAKILMNKKMNLKEEMEFLEKGTKGVREKRKIYLIARDGNKVVANTSIEIGVYKRNHIGRFAIGIRNGYRGSGLGTYLMQEIMKLAKKELNPNPRIFQLEVYENNKPAIGLYKKMGFKIVGKIPKQIQHKGKLIAEYIMIKKI